ncbi:sensor histidine kinase [Euzebyella saccharophila]|uniref:histidine kinase n=1 Tax=Euzebyella saccharophila TaxID=679664 RepID=A0ABV8JRD3_9FLAO|nr:sensor histidine kinase [Euzebyella saccharophila]
MVKGSKIDTFRLGNKTSLLLKFNYSSSLLSFVFALLCIFLLDIKETIPFVFILYATLNGINVWAFNRHGNLTTMAIYTSVLSWISTIVISLCSGGIQSPFLFVLSIIVLAGYVSTKLFGTIYLYSITATIFIIFFIDYLSSDVMQNEVPEASRDLFSLFSMLFAVYLLGYIFGKNLLETHHNLYRSKNEIENRIEEKETLLKEVHHRVKNNLQTVSSLLNLQARNSKNEKIKDLLKGSQNRVLSMAMIHEMLYLNQNISKIDFRSYVEQLTEYLLNSAISKNKKITLELNIPELQLGIDTAIPLGLLINETVTNSIKYGFTEENDGIITIILEKLEKPNLYKLSISDNGIGFKEQIDLKEIKSLGLKLIHNLARQLHGSIRGLNTVSGTSYILTFKEIDKKG